MKTVTQSNAGTPMKQEKDAKAGGPPPVPEQQESGINYEEDAGAGMGGHTTRDFKIPFLTILQALSPQCTENDAKYNENCRPGQVVNTVTGEIFEARASKEAFILVVPIDRVTEYPEWKPSRGGLVKVHLDESILDQCKKGTGEKDTNTDYLPNGNIIDTTSKWFVMQSTDEGYLPSIIAMARTNLKHSRAWLTKIGGYRGKKKDGTFYTMPMYSRHWKLSTVPEVKNGNTFYCWNAEPGDLVVNVNSYLELKSTREQVVKGQLALPDSSASPENALPERSY